MIANTPRSPPNESTVTTAVRSATSGRPPRRLHHNAWVTLDQEATRAFYEDIVGLPLVATWTEAAPLMGEDEQAFCHTFYALGDGGALAFFQFADADFAQRHAPERPPSPFRHFALLVDEATQHAVHDRATRAGFDAESVDHGYCRSVYLTDPNGLRLELTVDHHDIARITAIRRAEAHQDLQRWLAGDHTTNNDWRPDTEGSPVGGSATEIPI